MISSESIHELFEWNSKALAFRYPQYLIDFLSDANRTSISCSLDNTKQIQVDQVYQLDIRCFVLIRAIELKALYSRIAGNKSQGIILIEPDFTKLTTFFCRKDFREELLSPYVHWIVGERWQEHLSNLIQELGLFHLPPGVFRFIPESSRNQDELFPLLNDVKKLFAKTMRTQIHHFNTQRDLFLRKSPNTLKTEPCKIWAHVEPKSAVYSRMTRSLLQGFAQLGCEVHLSDFRNEWCAREKVMSELIRFSPDVVFFLNGPSFNRFRYLGLPENLAERLSCRRITWYVDHPRFLSGFESHAQWCQYDDAGVIDQTFFSEFENPKPRTLFHLPHAVMIDRKGRDIPDYRFPIVYVGSLVDPRKSLESLSSKARVSFDEILTEYKKRRAIPFLTIIDTMNPSSSVLDELVQCATQFNINRMSKQFSTPLLNLEYYCYVASTFYTRSEYVTALLPLGLHVFGPDDWLAILGDQYRDRHHGLIDAADLPDCYASAEINLNFHSAQCPTCLNNRDFDIPYAEGFLLSDWVEDSDKGFLQDGEHFRTFHNPDDLVEKVYYYLKHPDEAQEIRQNGSEWVTKNHTMLHRAELILKQVYPDFRDFQLQNE